MSELAESLRRAEQRLAGRGRRRADRGRSRLRPEIEAEIRRHLSGDQRPRMTHVHREIAALCGRLGIAVPSRSTLYNAIERATPPAFHRDELPEHVRRTLHNVAPGPIPGHQIVFAAFNYGDTRALSWAAGMPWLCLHHAYRTSGWRPKSRALLRAVMSIRGIHVEPTARAQ